MSPGSFIRFAWTSFDHAFEKVQQQQQQQKPFAQKHNTYYVSDSNAMLAQTSSRRCLQSSITLGYLVRKSTERRRNDDAF